MECYRCGEQREYLDKDQICMCCRRAEKEVGGTEIKNEVYGNFYGKEIKSKSGSIKRGQADNMWMNK